MLKNLLVLGSALTAIAYSTSSHASMLVCQGAKILDSSGAALVYQVNVDRALNSTQPGNPATVTIRSRLETNTAEPSQFGQPETRDAGYFSTSRDYYIVFQGGEIVADPDGMGAFKGTIKINGNEMSAYCTEGI